jgi:ribosomal protein L30E
VVEALQVEVRCGQASMGADAVAEGLRARRIAAVLVAQDAGRSTRERAEHQASQAGVPVIELWDGARLGALFGRESVVLVGIGDRARAERLAQDCKSLANLAAFEG